MNNIIYLDNSSTTKPCEKCREYISQALCENWGNPSSLHTLGIEAEMLVERAREFLAEKISASPEEIIFTSGGTEANNTAVLSAEKSRSRKAVTTVIEHPSVSEPFKRLEEHGFSVKRISCGADGVISTDELEKSLESDTALVSIMLVNNESGAVQPIEEAEKIIRRCSPRALIHCDAVQAFGKLPVNVRKLGVDMLSVSAHKIGGPKGIGFLYRRRGIKMPCLISGGGQERGMRSGTESVPLIAGFLGAAEELGEIRESLSHVSELKSYAAERLLRSGLAEINSPEDALPYILNISVNGYRSETLLHFLEQRGIYVSSGSACAKGHKSYVLAAMGLSPDRIDSALRLSFSKNNTKEEIDLTVAALQEATQRLRRSKI